MEKTNWNTGDIITEDKVNLIETKVEALLNTVNSLVGVVRGLERYMSKIEGSEVYGLDEDSNTKNDIGYNSPAPITINPEETDLQSLINNTITGRINTTWPDTATLENAGDDIVGIEGGDSLATSVNSLMRYIDKCMKSNYNDLEENIKNATKEYYSKYVTGDILITTISRENEGEEKGNTLSNEDTNLYWVPFGQGRMLIGAGTGTDINNYTMEFPQKVNENIILKGGEYIHTLTINEIPSHQHKLSNSDIKFISSWSKTGDTGTSKNVCVKSTNMKNLNTVNTGGGQSHNNLPPYIVVYFYKCCDEEEYNTYYDIQPSEETEENSSSNETENNTPSEGTSTDSENP